MPACYNFSAPRLAYNKVKDVRPSPIAGTWYPGDPEVLAGSVDQMLALAGPPQAGENIIGIIVPHAGHRYSGHVAGRAFGCLAGSRHGLVVIVAPFHGRHDSPILTTSHAAYQTPLGEVPVDTEALARFEDRLSTISDLRVTRVARDGEHSLEIELPFLQRALPQPFRLLPLMLRDQSRAAAEAVGRALADSVPPDSPLLIASSDLSHYRPTSEARRLDQMLLHRIESFDPAGVLSAEEEGLGYACGKGAIAAVLWAAQRMGATKARIVHYADSGDITGDRSAVVGYGAAVIYRPRP
ncbi:MAG: AmmeMemoRadiSam system protein B [Anaerolineales bacterium]